MGRGGNRATPDPLAHFFRVQSGEGHMLLGAHCQCAFLAPRTQSDNPQAVLVPICGRLRKVPAWVANQNWGDVSDLRFHFRDRRQL